MGQKEVDEAVFRYEEIQRLTKELSAAVEAWQDWTDGLSPEELKEYYRVTGTRPWGKSAS